MYNINLFFNTIYLFCTIADYYYYTLLTNIQNAWEEPELATTDSRFAGGQFSPLHIPNGAVPTCSLLLEGGCEHLQKDHGRAHPPTSAHFLHVSNS